MTAAVTSMLPPVAQFDHATLTALIARSTNDQLVTRARAELVRRHAALTNVDTPGICKGRWRTLTDAIAHTGRGGA